MTNKRGEARTEHVPGTLLGDILDANLDPCAKLQALRDWVRRALRPTKLRDGSVVARHVALFGWRPRARIDYHAPRHPPTK